jgi:hypothetical protein
LEQNTIRYEYSQAGIGSVLLPSQAINIFWAGSLLGGRRFNFLGIVRHLLKPFPHSMRETERRQKLLKLAIAQYPNLQPNTQVQFHDLI